MLVPVGLGVETVADARLGAAPVLPVEPLVPELLDELVLLLLFDAEVLAVDPPPVPLDAEVLAAEALPVLLDAPGPVLEAEDDAETLTVPDELEPLEAAVDPELPVVEAAEDPAELDDEISVALEPELDVAEDALVVGG